MKTVSPLSPELLAKIYEKPMRTAEEVAEFLGTSKRHVYTLRALGKLPFSRISARCVRLSADALREFVERAAAPSVGQQRW